MPFTVCSFRMPMASMLRRSRDSENPPEAMLSFGASSCWFLSYWVPLCLGSSCWFLSYWVPLCLGSSCWFLSYWVP
ncbi:hypothetical protein FH717_17100, partial [Bacteroides thetaiotaomicron]